MPFTRSAKLGLETGQRFARQRRAGLGRIALPGQRVGDVELGLRQQGLGLLRPFGRDGLLALGALDFVELLAQQSRGALVAAAQFLEHVLHLLGRRVAGEPVADALGPLARGRRREGAAGQRVEGLEVVGLGGGRGHCARDRCTGLDEKAKAPASAGAPLIFTDLRQAWSSGRQIELGAGLPVGAARRVVRTAPRNSRSLGSFCASR